MVRGGWKLKMVSVAYWDGNPILFHLRKIWRTLCLCWASLHSSSLLLISLPTIGLYPLAFTRTLVWSRMTNGDGDGDGEVVVSHNNSEVLLIMPLSLSCCLAPIFSIIRCWYMLGFGWIWYSMAINWLFPLWGLCMCASLNIIGTRRVEVHSSQQVLGTKKGSLSGIDPEVPTRKLPTRKEEVGLLKRTWHHLCHFEWFWWLINNAIKGINTFVKWTFLDPRDVVNRRSKARRAAPTVVPLNN